MQFRFEDRLKQKGVKIHTFEKISSTKGHAVFDTKTRDKWLLESGLQDEIKKFDELDKDLLVKRASAFSLVRLKKSYPTFSATKIELLKKKVQE